MEDDGSVTLWLGQLKSGDESAAQQLWERYYRRLVGLARVKLRNGQRRVMDEEDVVQSAFQSFCKGAEEGRFPQLQDRDDLWRLLVVITARKAINQQKYLNRKIRGNGKSGGESWLQVGGEDAERRALEQVVGAEPTPEFAAAIVEDFDQLLERLGDETLRLIAFWKFEGRSNPEIAKHLDCSLSAVERKLRLIRQQLTEIAPT